MIAFSTPSFDQSGAIVLQRTETSNTMETTRRVSRTATLDGGAVLTDMGFSDADRTFEIEIRNADSESEDAMTRLARQYPQLLCATRDGLFLGAIQNVKRDGTNLNITFLVLGKQSQD